MTERLPPDYCLWEMDESRFVVGILGTGPGFLSILDIIFSPDIGEFLPPMHLRALAEPGFETEKLKDHRIGSVPIYASYQEMLAHHPDINLLIELSGKRYKVRQIVANLPDSVSFIDHTASFFLCALTKFASMSAYCRTNLTNQRALLQAIVDEVPEDIVLLDKSGLVVDCNANVIKRRGLPKEELLNRPCWDVQSIRGDMPFCHPQSRNCPFYTTLATGQKSESLETRVSEDGRLLYFRVYAYPIYGATGAISHVMMMRRDITSRTEGEKKAQQEEKMGLLGRMSSYLAHEIRNPLFAIGGFTNSLLKSPNLSERELEKVRIILEETARLDHILKEILGFAKPTEAAPSQVDVALLARQAVDILKGGFVPAGVELVFVQSATLPLCVAEPDAFKRCVIHLVDNAFEAMDATGKVEVEAGLDKGQPVLMVRDTGRGMPKDVLERVFSPFFTTKGKGYGMGLAMIRKMMDDWGGAVEISSQEGRGTVVTLKLAPVLAVGGGASEKL